MMSRTPHLGALSQHLPAGINAKEIPGLAKKGAKDGMLQRTSAERHREGEVVTGERITARR